MLIEMEMNLFCLILLGFLFALRMHTATKSRQSVPVNKMFPGTDITNKTER